MADKPCQRWLNKMVKSGMKIPLIIAAVWIVGIGAPVCQAADAGQLPVPVGGLDAGGIYALRQIEANLTGSGIDFAVISRSITYTDGLPQNDYRPAVGHKCLANAEITFHDEAEPAAGISAHSTAVCSILFGDDPNAFHESLGRFHYQGAAPDAKAGVYEFWYFLTNNVFGATVPEADVISASFGIQSEKWWTRGLDAMAQHHGVVIVAGIGNGSAVFDPPLYPAGGANVIGVGVVDHVKTADLKTALENSALAYPERSTAGPSAGGLCKPDIVAAGNYLAAHPGEPNLYEPTGSWSSFATPVVAATAGLLIQKANDDPDLADAVEAAERNCLIKSLLLNSATKLPYWHKGRLTKDDDHTAPLDYIQGAGMLNPVGAYENLIAGRFAPGPAPQTGWDAGELRPDEISANVYKIALDDPKEKFITATAVWNKNFSSRYPFEALADLDADLRLELWAVDPERAENDYLLDYSDSGVDALEHIYCAADPNYSNYELIISYSKLDDRDNSSVSHRYALAWGLAEGPDDENILWYDLNADGSVDDRDLTTLLDNWITSRSQPDSYYLGDIDGDGSVDFNDIEILYDHNDLTAGWLGAESRIN